MALLKRDNSTNIIPPPGSQTEIRSTGRPGWLILLGAIVAILLISTGLVYGGRWVYRSITNESSKPPAPQATQNTKSIKSTQKQSTQRSPSAGKSPTTPPSGSNKASKPSASNNQLPNNGPGEVVALFVGASLAAASLHYLINLRRQAS